MPIITKELADQLAKVAQTQIRVSRDYKEPRMKEINESEDLYFGVVKKELKNPFNLTFPFMSGFVDHFLSKIDDPPEVEFSQTSEADLKLSQKITSAFNNEKDSVKASAKWALKDRWVKKDALFSGRGIYEYSASRPNGRYKSKLNRVSYHCFHAEPAGGGHLEDHLFCGKENVYKTKEELVVGAKEKIYDGQQVARLLSHAPNMEYKDVADERDKKWNKHRALGLDPQTNNYIGQELYRFNEWYLTFNGTRFYLLWDEVTNLWVRCKFLKDINSSEELPFKTWATNEDGDIFWSKAPCDDARPIAKYVNKALNQELYNREKQNRGQRAYDAEMFHDIKALADWRPDGLIPFDSKGGARSVQSGLYEFNVSGLNGTLDLVTYLDNFFGQKTGSTPSSQGTSDKNKKVGIFFGELEQVSEFIGTKNKSYKECWAEIGMAYINGLDDNLDNQGLEIKLMGVGGEEWSKLTRKDMKKNREFDIKVKGGSDALMESEVDRRKRTESLGLVQTVNPRWRDEQIMKAGGYTEEEIKQAFSQLPFAQAELMSEAAQSIEDILNGKTPKLNRGANASFMQKIIDTAKDLDTSMEKFDALMEYAMAHTDIVIENEARNALEIINNAKAQQATQNMGMGVPGAIGSPELPNPNIRPTTPDLQQNPVGEAISAGQQAGNQLI